MQCCHNDGNKHNNKLSNLRWDTATANQLDKNKHGTSNKGTKHTQTTINKIKNTKYEHQQQGKYDFINTRSVFKNQFQLNIVRHLINFNTLQLSEIGAIFCTDRTVIWRIKHKIRRLC